MPRRRSRRSAICSSRKRGAWDPPQDGARECFDAFVDHLNPLIQATLPTQVPLEAVVLEGKPDVAALGFRGDVYTVPLPTKHGRLHFGLAQSLECVEDKEARAQERFLLKTRQYWYRIQLAEGQAAAAIIRWEYLSPTLPAYKDHGKRWC